MFLNHNIKYRFITLVSVVNYNTRLIHLASQNCIRKKLVTYSEPSETLQNYGREAEVSSHGVNANVNFYGIDGDEGVTTIDSKNYENYVEKDINRKSKEKFFRSSFGVIRQDVDNQIRFHGQYDSALSSSFPHSSTELAEVSGNYHHSKSKLFSALNDDKVCKLKLNNKDSIVNATQITHNGNSSVNESEVNYVDECFFEDIKDQYNFSKYNNTKSSFHKESELSYIDECVFEGPDCKDGFLKFSNKSDHHQKVSDDLNSNLELTPGTDAIMQENNMPLSQANCFEEIIFPNLDKIDNYSKSLSFTDVKKQLDHLDESSFKNLSETEDSVNDRNSQQDTDIRYGFPPGSNIAINTLSQCDITRDSFSESDRKPFADEPNKSDFIENLSSINSQMNPNSSVVENLLPFSVKEDAKTQNNHEYQITEKIAHNVTRPSLLNMNSVQSKPAHSKNSLHPFEGYISITNKNSTYAEHDQKQSSLHQHIGTLESSVISNIRLNDMYQSSKTPKFVNKDEVSGSASNIPVTNDGHTAYDFVTELRKKQELESIKDQREEISSSLNSPKTEKLDSKGFRILKNQATDLSYFTRNEILDLLKRSIIYSDDNLLVLNKPYSLIMHESQTTKSPCLSSFLDNLAKELDQQAPDPKLFTLHRLDKETTGCMLLARNEITAQKLKSLFAQRKIIKKYWIVTIRVPNPLKGVIDIPISEGTIHGKQRMVLHPDIPNDILYKNHCRSGKRAVTSYKVLCISGNAALVEATPETGIKHQIRVHFGFGLSCPILGDHKYSHFDKLAPQKLASDLLQRLHVRQSKVRYIPMHIHSKSITIPNYFEGRDLFVMAPLPIHMTENLKKLKFKKKNQLSL